MSAIGDAIGSVFVCLCLGVLCLGACGDCARHEYREWDRTLHDRGDK